MQPNHNMNHDGITVNVGEVANDDQMNGALPEGDDINKGPDVTALSQAEVSTNGVLIELGVRKEGSSKASVSQSRDAVSVSRTNPSALTPDPEAVHVDLEKDRQTISEGEQKIAAVRTGVVPKISDLYAGLGFDPERIREFAKSHGLPEPRSNAIFPEDMMCVLYYGDLNADRSDASVAVSISTMTKVVAVLRLKNLSGDKARAFLQANGGIKGVYAGFDNQGQPKVKKKRQPVPGGRGGSHGSGSAKGEPAENNKAQTEGAGSEGGTKTGRNEHEVETGEAVQALSLPPLISDAILARAKSDFETASMNAKAVQKEIAKLEGRTDNDAKGKLENFRAESKALVSKLEVGTKRVGMLERLRTVTIIADGDLKLGTLPPSVIREDVTTHDGFALMLVAVNDDGSFSGVANLTPDLAEFSKLITQHFEKSDDPRS